MEKVLTFYRKQPGLTSLSTDRNGRRFLKEEGGHSVYVIVDSPWQSSSGGEMSRDTKISIISE